MKYYEKKDQNKYHELNFYMTASLYRCLISNLTALLRNLINNIYILYDSILRNLIVQCPAKNLLWTLYL